MVHVNTRSKRVFYSRKRDDVRESDDEEGENML